MGSCLKPKIERTADRTAKVYKFINLSRTISLALPPDLWQDPAFPHRFLSKWSLQELFSCLKAHHDIR